MGLARSRSQGEDGVFKPREHVRLEEKTEVLIVKGAPPAVAENHDKCLYGDPEK